MATRINHKYNGRIVALLSLYSLYKFSELERKPTVTAALLLGNILPFMRKLGPINALLPTADQVAFNSYRILEHGELKRFFLSPFYHVSKFHFVYDTLTILWEGIELEGLMGSFEYASMFVTLVIMSQAIQIVGRYLLLFSDNKWPYYRDMVVGCTNVMFALNYIGNALPEGDQYIWDYKLPRYFTTWIELIMAQIYGGVGDFCAHLGGILTGFLYLQFKSSKTGPDPLAKILRDLMGRIRKQWEIYILRSRRRKLMTGWFFRFALFYALSKLRGRRFLAEEDRVRQKDKN